MAKNNPTKDDIMNRLDQLGIEYSPSSNKAELSKLLEDSVEEPEVPKATVKKKVRKLSNKDSFQTDLDIRNAKEALKSEKYKRLLKKKGYDWYYCQARTVTNDHGICRRGRYYPLHKDEVERLGSIVIQTVDRRGQPITEPRMRFRKERPEEMQKRLAEEGEFDANDFVG